MTDVQVKYVEYKEGKRHNEAMEAQSRAELEERKRSNLANETISTNSLAETHRHNLATESLGISELAEATRSHKVNEKENVRHNKAGEKETKRHNKATEKETTRSNKKQESIAVTRNDLTRALNASNISLNSQKIEEIINDMSRAGVNNLVKSGNPVNSTTGLVLELVDIISNPNSSSAQKKAAEKALNKVYKSSDGKTVAKETWKDIVSMGKDIVKKGFKNSVHNPEYKKQLQKQVKEQKAAKKAAKESSSKKKK